MVLGPHATVTAFTAETGAGLGQPFRSSDDCVTASGPVVSTPLRLEVAAGVRCVVAPVNPTATGTYLLRFTAHTVGSATGRICLWQPDPPRCAALPDLPSAPELTAYTAVVRVLPNQTGVRLYLVAGASSGAGVAEYRDVSLTPLRVAGQATLEPVAADPATVQLAAGPHIVTVSLPASPPTGSPQFKTCLVPGTDAPSWNQRASAPAAVRRQPAP